MNKYLLRDGDSSITVGYCEDIEWLGNTTWHVEGDYHLQLIGLVLTEQFVEHCKTTKCRLSTFYICFLDQEGKEIGNYFFGLYESRRISTFQNSNSNHIDLTGQFFVAPRSEALEIWSQWMKAKPERINTWAGLTEEQRLGWQEVVRLHSGYADYPIEAGKDFYLDLTYVTSSSTFLCALGEAMNGPGGYYGFCLDSLHDCFCVGFGAVPPFRLHLVLGDLNRLIADLAPYPVDQRRLLKIRDLLVSYSVSIVPA